MAASGLPPGNFRYSQANRTSRRHWGRRVTAAAAKHGDPCRNLPPRPIRSTKPQQNTVRVPMAADDFDMPKGQLMKGKKGLVMGVANANSIAWGIASQLAHQGA